eukprot:7417366-Karenia_brevis.AAC.1
MEALVHTLLLWFHVLQEANHLPSEGSRILAVLSAVYPCVNEQSHLLVRPRRALKGWERLMPPETRLPLPLFVMFLWAEGMADLGYPEMSIALLLALDAYLRPGE